MGAQVDLARAQVGRPQPSRPVPEISGFFGIVIRMYFDDHPPPHFHASYAGHEGRITVLPIGVMSGGDLPPRPLALAVEWRAERLDHPGALVAGYPGKRRRVIHAAAPFGIGKVDADGLETNQDLARPRLRRGMGAEGEDAWVTQGVNDDRSHAATVSQAKWT
jgi:hypothetical protein